MRIHNRKGISNEYPQCIFMKKKKMSILLFLKLIYLHIWEDNLFESPYQDDYSNKLCFGEKKKKEEGRLS